MGLPEISPLPLAAAVCGGILTCVCSTAKAEDERAACATTAEHAQELRAAHKLREAREKLVDCARPSCPNVVNRDCAQWLSEVNDVIPSIVVKAIDSAGRNITAASVWADGIKVLDALTGEPLTLDPGIHRIRLEAAGMQSVEEQVALSEGDHNGVVTLQLKPLAPSTPVLVPSRNSGSNRVMTALPYALAGVGIVALGSFTYFGIRGKSEADDLAAGCGATKTCSESQVDPVRHRLLAADISLGVSLLSLGAATWMFVARHSDKERTTAIQVQANPGAAFAKLNVAF
jgi:hypothetical protein